MNNWNFLALTITVCTIVNGNTILAEEGDVIEEGLYKKSENVVILTINNFNRKVFGQSFANVVQFYNRYCGVCRNFRPRFRKLALTLKHWNNILRVAAIDCSVEENNRICIERTVGFPTLRYLHDHYVKDSTFGVQLSDKIHYQSVAEIKAIFARLLQATQKEGHLTSAPDMQIYSYSSYKEAIRGTPKNIMYTFLVFENDNSSIGAELALDMNDYNLIKVRSVYDDSRLAKKTGISNFPAVVAVNPSCKSKVIKVRRNATAETFLKCINKFLHSIKYRVPVRDKVEDEPHLKNGSNLLCPVHGDIVFYNDLEKAIRISLTTEIIKRMDGERLQALLDYLEILITNYPFRNDSNLKAYLTQLLNALGSRSEWSPLDIYDMVIRLEKDNTPVYTDNLDFVACKGSAIYYRGLSCGLWHLYHTLTVNALNKPGTEGPKVLRAMHGYMKYFLMCGGCSKHFQEMSIERKLFDVQDNEEAMLWLWISHNVVNLRLSGDNTEDPVYPKIQFPSQLRCPECRDSEGEWNLPAVSKYLQYMYSPQYIKEMPRSSKNAVALESPFFSLNGILRYL